MRVRPTVPHFDNCEFRCRQFSVVFLFFFLLVSPLFFPLLMYAYSAVCLHFVLYFILPFLTVHSSCLFRVFVLFYRLFPFLLLFTSVFACSSFISFLLFLVDRLSL
jgi:hypothetical protein